jgi:hypothetical protein
MGSWKNTFPHPYIEIYCLFSYMKQLISWTFPFRRCWLLKWRPVLDAYACEGANFAAVAGCVANTDAIFPAFLVLIARHGAYKRLLDDIEANLFFIYLEEFCRYLGIDESPYRTYSMTRGATPRWGQQP